jgi:hypothetical protein
MDRGCRTLEPAGDGLGVTITISRRQSIAYRKSSLKRKKKARGVSP